MVSFSPFTEGVLLIPAWEHIDLISRLHLEDTMAFILQYDNETGEALNVTLSPRILFSKDAKTCLTPVLRLLYWLWFLSRNPNIESQAVEVSVLL